MKVQWMARKVRGLSPCAPAYLWVISSPLATACLLLRGGEKGWELQQESKAVTEIGPKCSSGNFFMPECFRGTCKSTI